MTSVREGTEAGLIVASLGLFVGYHVWLFGFRGKWYKVQDKYHDFFQAGKLARSLWAEACATDEKDAILGVQQARNAMTACTYLATISVALATAGITVVFDSSKIERIRVLSVNDPIMRYLPGSPLVPATVIICLALGSLYCSFVCFAQSVRLYVHTGFYIRACTSRFNPGTLRVSEAKKVAIHAGMAFSVGLRLFYLFIPLVMWSVGVTALVISSLIMTALIAYMDHFDMTIDENDPEEQESLTSHQQQQQQQQLDSVASNGPRIQLAATSGSVAGVAEGPSQSAGQYQQQQVQEQQQQQYGMQEQYHQHGQGQQQGGRGISSQRRQDSLSVTGPLGRRMTDDDLEVASMV